MTPVLLAAAAVSGGISVLGVNLSVGIVIGFLVGCVVGRKWL